ncbi:hypothetical protein OHA61_34065 [Streptomyces sp. NBC_00885]|uniref:hypothetical protein n=1 Tax=Streptomyces sp. NBC_00885 TaxID=2975857 RepID=UPI00386A4C01|nr:hypothetical protein OHA61_34065 [Streptomyces sp. NBC_00885]
MHELDMDRLPFEITRALDENGIIPEMLTPGLAARPEIGELVILSEGEEVCRIPRYRLRTPDPELLRRAAHATLATMPTDIADRCSTAINQGAFEVEAPPDQDYVYVNVFLGDGEPFKFFKAHRRTVVPGWPE